MRGSCALERINVAEVEHIKLHGVSEGKEYVDDASCRRSGLADKEWCTVNGIVVSSFYNTVVRLRKKACRIPEREQDGGKIHDLTASSLPDVVPVSILPEEVSYSKTLRPEYLI